MVEHRLEVSSTERIRLDQFLADAGIGVTRTHARRLIEGGNALVNDKAVTKASAKLKQGDVVKVSIPAAAPLDVVPQNLPLDILFEDEFLVVVNKKAGMVVHPAPGHPDGTLVNALLYHCKNLSGIGGTLRPGIVHRLDKDTSGVMVVSKTDKAHQGLADGFQHKTHQRQYVGFCIRKPSAQSVTYDTFFGRHPVHRKKFSSKVPNGKRAKTHVKIERVYPAGFSKCTFVLETGRTHQIRVHAADHGHPIVSDSLYGRKPGGKLKSIYDGMTRQALHALKLGFVHPCTYKELMFETPLPKDMEELSRKIELLE